MTIQQYTFLNTLMSCHQVKSEGEGFSVQLWCEVFFRESIHYTLNAVAAVHQLYRYTVAAMHPLYFEPDQSIINHCAEAPNLNFATLSPFLCPKLPQTLPFEIDSFQGVRL